MRRPAGRAAVDLSSIWGSGCGCQCVNVMGTWLFGISHAIVGEVWRRRTESDTALPWKLCAILRIVPHGLTEEPGRLGANGDDQDKNKAWLVSRAS